MDSEKWKFEVLESKNDKQNENKPVAILRVYSTGALVLLKHDLPKGDYEVHLKKGD